MCFSGQTRKSSASDVENCAIRLYPPQSGRVYTDMLVQYPLALPQRGASGSPRKVASAWRTAPAGRRRSMPAAAKPRFYKACKTAAACRELGLGTHYPHERKRFRTTIWKHTGIRKRARQRLLARAKGDICITASLNVSVVGHSSCASCATRFHSSS